MKLANTLGIAVINLQKCAQAGASEVARCLLGFWAHTDPDPVGLALPNKVKGEQIVADYVAPMFRDTPVLSELLSERLQDVKRTQITLTNSFRLYLVWGGSATSAKTHPMRRAICDEVNDFDPFSEGQAHGVDLMSKRLRTFEDRAFQLNLGTPTTATEKITVLFEGSDHQLYFLVECPQCERWIRLVWAQVVFSREPGESERDWAARVYNDAGAAQYKCQGCGERFDDITRRRLIQDGKWGTVDEDNIGDGRIEDAEAVEEWPLGTSLGMQFSALYCTWVTMSKIAAENIRARGDLSKMFDFVTQTLGEAYQVRSATLASDLFSDRSERSANAEGVLPWWTARLIATVDTQQEGFWLVIRAWGPGMRSQRVFHGFISNEEELDRWLFQNPWRFEGDRYQPMTVTDRLIDSGGTTEEGHAASRTMDVYRYVLQRSPQVRAIKGDSHPKPGLFSRPGTGWLKSTDKRSAAHEVPITLLDVHHYQDILVELINRQVTNGPETGTGANAEQVWTLNRRNDREYNAHMSNLVKVAKRVRGHMVQLWEAKSSGARVDLRHCEGYQVAAAELAGVHLLPDLETFRQMRDAQQAAVIQRETAKRGSGQTGRERAQGGITTPDGRPFLITQR